MQIKREGEEGSRLVSENEIEKKLRDIEKWMNRGCDYKHDIRVYIYNEVKDNPRFICYICMYLGMTRGIIPTTFQDTPSAQRQRSHCADCVSINYFQSSSWLSSIPMSVIGLTHCLRGNKIKTIVHLVHQDF